MEPYRFEDALTGKTVACTYPGLRAWVVEDAPASAGDRAAAGGGADADAAGAHGAGAGAGGEGAGAPAACTALFCPGCSLVNYALPLVRSVYDLLAQAGRVDGMSLLCCGKILSFEPDGQRVRAEFERQMCDHVVRAGVRRIVAACPNCVAALRAALSRDERTADVQVVVLPQELANMGYRIDEGVLRRMVAAEAPVAPEDVAVCVHDSCPDRSTGEFADGTRALLPGGVLVETAHVRNRSFCCGSLVRAAGKLEAADKQARRHGEEAEAAGAAAVVTACVSCAFQLSTAQRAVPVFHYLELLYDWRVDWAHADQYMKLRFLFDAEPPAEAGNRAFVGLEGACGAEDAGAGVGLRDAGAGSQGTADAAAGAMSGVDADAEGAALAPAGDEGGASGSAPAERDGADG